MDTESVSGKIIAVTGGAGFIGSHLCDKLLSCEPEKIVVIDDFSLGKRENLVHLEKNPKVRILRLDASNYNPMRHVFKKERIDVVFNLAVLPLPKSLVAPKETIDKNILITTTICELLRRGLCRTLIHCSSSEAYGTAMYVPMDEDHPMKPLTPYAASKTACDNIVMSYCRTFDADIATARPFNAYGPHQNSGSYAAVIPITIRRILAGQHPIIHGDGLQTRDCTYVEDITDALVKLYEVPLTRGKAINLASGKEIRIEDLIKLIARLMNCTKEILYSKPRPADVRRHRGDISLAKKLLGYSPKTDYETGLQKTIEWYRNGSLMTKPASEGIREHGTHIA